MASSTSAEPAVRLTDVTKSFGGHVAVNDLSLTIPRGAVYGFIGPNGAGKTSTIRMIMHIHLPDRGQVEVLGRPAGRETTERVGYLPEERGLYPKMNVAELILYLGRLKGRSRAELLPRIDAWLERMGLTAWRAKKCQELSKGMQQKVQFIATVVHDPDLVILDEPFSGLDPLNAELMIGIVDEWKRAGKTVIFSTHVMEHAEKLCDSVFMICKGRKVLDGSLGEIQSRYREEVVDVAGEGARSLLVGAPGVRAVHDHPGRFELELEPGADPQRVLAHLVGRFKLARFESRTPRLHDLFLRLAGPGEATATGTMTTTTAGGE